VLKIAISLFILGLSFGAGPCLASCGPVFLCYAAGKGKNIPKSVTGYLLFSLARVSGYVIFGLLIYFLGKNLIESALGSFSRFLYIAGGAFIICTGLLSISLNRPVIGDKKDIFVLGLIIGFLPCAPLLAVVSYAALSSRSLFEVVFFMLFFGAGTLLSPLLIMAAGAGYIPKLLSVNGRYFRLFAIFCGLLMVFLGAQLIMRGIMGK